MRAFIMVLLGAWTIAFVGSFALFFLGPDKGVGLDAGLNRLSQFMIWQAVATVLAVIALISRWASDDPLVRRLGAIPAMGIGVVVLIVGGLYLWSMTQAVDPSEAYTPPKQTTTVSE